MTTLESKLRALVAEWREAARLLREEAEKSDPTQWHRRGLLETEADTYEPCASRIEALLAERQPVVTVTSGTVPSCTADAIRESGKWKTFEYPAFAERQEPPADWRTVIIGLPTISKLLNAEDVELNDFHINLIPDDTLSNNREDVMVLFGNDTLTAKRIFNAREHLVGGEMDSRTLTVKRAAAPSSGTGERE